MIIMDSNKQRESDNNGMKYILVKRETMLRAVAKLRQFLRSNFQSPIFKDPQISMIERSKDSKIHRFPAKKIFKGKIYRLRVKN